MLHEIKSSQFVLRNYENLLFVYFVVYNGKNEKHTKSEQDCESDWISFLNLAAKIQNIKVMKKNNFNVFNDVDAYIYVSNICNLPLLQMAYQTAFPFLVKFELDGEEW